MDPQTLIIWLVIGAVAGWLAGLIVTGFGFGLVGNIVVGIVGAFVAGWLLPNFWPMAGILGAIIHAADWRHHRPCRRRPHKASMNPRRSSLPLLRQFICKASRRATSRLSSGLSRERSWQLTPGTSSIQPIHRRASCLMTAVYSATTELGDALADVGFPSANPAAPARCRAPRT